MSWFRYSSDDPTKVMIRYTLDADEEWDTWDFGRRHRQLPNSGSILKMKYSSSNPKKRMT